MQGSRVIEGENTKIGHKTDIKDVIYQKRLNRFGSIFDLIITN